MKKIFLSIIIFLGSVNVVFASTKTYERTTDNLRIPNNVVVNEENINYILNTKAVDANEKIYDFADILTEKEETNLYKDIDNFVKDTTLDLIILTEKGNLNLDNANYAFNFYPMFMKKKFIPSPIPFLLLRKEVMFADCVAELPKRLMIMQCKIPL